MQVTCCKEFNDYIEIEIFDGINRHIHLLNSEYKAYAEIKNISLLEYEKLVENCVLENLYYKSIRKILCKKRSIAYIKEYLNKKLPDTRYIETIILRLKKAKYLDDIVYTKAYINDMIYIYKYGPIKIQYNLEKNNIEKSVINDEIKVYTYELVIKNIEFYVQKFLKTNKDSYMMFKDKCINKLISKGYNIDDILKYFENNDIIIYEDVLIKNYLSNSKVDLLKLKDRLVKRGFNPDKVVEIIEKNKEKKTLL